MSSRRLNTDLGLPRFRSRIDVRANNPELPRRFDTWLVHQGYSESTRAYYCKIIREASSFFGNRTFRSIAPLDIEAFLEHASRNGWHVWRHRHYLAALRCFFEFLYLGGLVDSVAPRFVRSPRKVHRLPKVLTQDEVARLIDSATNPRDRALLEFLYSTGCRIGELLRLKVENIDWRHRRVCVCGKGRERMVYIGNRAAKALKFYLSGRKAGPLFLDNLPKQRGQLARSGNIWSARWREYPSGKHRSMYLGNPNKMTYAEAKNKFTRLVRKQLLKRERRAMTKSSVERVIRGVGERVGLSGINPRVVRHCFATHLLENGADIRVIQGLLGHAFVATTEIYASLSNVRLDSAFRNCHPRAQ